MFNAEISAGSLLLPESRRLADDLPFESLANEFNELKHKIMLCEGIATLE